MTLLTAQGRGNFDVHRRNISCRGRNKLSFRSINRSRNKQISSLDIRYHFKSGSILHRQHVTSNMRRRPASNIRRRYHFSSDSVVNRSRGIILQRTLGIIFQLTRRDSLRSQRNPRPLPAPRRLSRFNPVVIDVTSTRHGGSAIGRTQGAAFRLSQHFTKTFCVGGLPTPACATLHHSTKTLCDRGCPHFTPLRQNISF